MTITKCAITIIICAIKNCTQASRDYFMSTRLYYKILDITNETVLEREVELICMTNSFEVRLNN